MTMKKYWLAGALAITISLWVVSGLGATTRLAIRAKPAPATFALTDTPSAKLTGDLAAILAAKDQQARLIGVNVQGEVIVDFGSDVTPQAAKDTIAEAPRNVTSRLQLEEQPFEKATQLIVVYSGKTAPKEVGGLKVVDSHPEGQFVVVESKEGFTAEQIESLANDKNTRLVQPNYVYRRTDETKAKPAPTAIPNDKLFGKLWGMRNINAPAAWNKITTSKVLVAVIDTGIDLKHQDLKANIVAGSKDFTSDNDPMDKNKHGTHCAGTIAAVGNNKEGVAGVAWKGKVIGVKIFGSGGFAGDVQVAKGIDHALAKGAKVLSNSWGGGAASPVLQAAITRAHQQKALFIAAAGNGGSDGIGDDNDAFPFFPASYPHSNIISVLAINQFDQITDFSNFGRNSVDIGAPGEDIVSTVLNKQYGSLSGTSMATPHVAGAASLIWSHPKFASLTHLQIKALILKNARPLPALTGKCVTRGTLNIKFLEAEKAVPAGEDKDEK